MKSVQILELIDTLWNVNFFGDMGEGITDEELIDTLWNVNKPFTDAVTYVAAN